MAITNSYNVSVNYFGDYNTEGEPAGERDSEFGANVTQNLISINNAYGATGISNTYANLYTNTFSPTSQNSVNEQLLIQDMVNESVFQNGVSLRYMPRWNPYIDDVFNEAPDATFAKGFLADMVIKTASGFEGEGDVLTLYGMEMKEEFECVIGITRFDELYQTYSDTLNDSDKTKYHRERPFEGDLLMVPFGRVSANSGQYFPKVFEILHVTTFHDGAFFQVGSNYQYRIKARLFDLSAEDLEFSPNVVDNDGMIVMSDTVGPIAKVKSENDILDDRGNFNLPNADLEADTWAKNKEIEENAQQAEKFHKDNSSEKVTRLSDDYTAKLHGMPGVINNLDDI